MAALDYRHVQLPRLCRRKAHLDAELFMGWRERHEPWRGDAEPVRFPVDGRNQLLGCCRPRDVRFKRYRHAPEDFCLDRAARPDVLQFAHAHSPAWRLFLAAHARLLLRGLPRFLPGTDVARDAFPPRLSDRYPAHP